MARFTTGNTTEILITVESDADGDVALLAQVGERNIRIAWLSAGSGMLRLQSLSGANAMALVNAGVELETAPGASARKQIKTRGF